MEELTMRNAKYCDIASVFHSNGVWIQFRGQIFNSDLIPAIPQLYRDLSGHLLVRREAKYKCQNM